MLSDNYVVMDVVQHVDDEKEYKRSRSFFRSLNKLKQKAWVFLIIVGLSSGIGYVAVYLPDQLETQSEGMSAMPGSPEEMKSKFDNLSEEQKETLMKAMGR